ncbi:regulator of chromosome condensation 1/beta-lactamase-inhibitor protein II [Delphinella strobiligena]|nr:regulator of chromosome condensation 1/beta-lactamase-inhibitor protein II [Delphinella strobiligena]
MPIYSLGSNGSGQLGIGHEDDTSSSSLISLSDGLVGAGLAAITSIRAGGNHTLLLTSSSEVYSVGAGEDGRCACQIMQSNVFRRATISAVKLCAATWDASIFVSNKDNSISVCGTGQKGELGLGPSTKNSLSVTSIPNFPPRSTKVIDLAACMGHVVVVLSNGDVWGWGNGQQGQLGEDAEVIWQPRRFANVPFKAVRAVCGKDFTAIFGDPDQGKLALFGVRKRDRLGIKANAPKEIPKWRDVQATWGGIYVLTDNGSLIAWGRDDHGQLPPEGLPKVSAIAAGSEHVLALTTEGKVLAFGWGEHGNCGEPVDEQKDVKGRWNELGFEGEAVGIGGGCSTSWIVTADKHS